MFLGSRGGTGGGAGRSLRNMFAPNNPDGKMWAIGICQTCYKVPKWCCCALVFTWCFTCHQRNRIYNGDMSQYSCCGGAFCGGCMDTCLETKMCPRFWLAVEAVCCTWCAVVGNRFLIQMSYQIQNSFFDNLLICCAVVCSWVFCLCSLCFGCGPQVSNAVQCLFCMFSACLLAQQENQLDVERHGRGAGVARPPPTQNFGGGRVGGGGGGARRLFSFGRRRRGQGQRLGGGGGGGNRLGGGQTPPPQQDFGGGYVGGNPPSNSRSSSRRGGASSSSSSSSSSSGTSRSNNTTQTNFGGGVLGGGSNRDSSFGGGRLGGGGGGTSSPAPAPSSNSQPYGQPVATGQRNDFGGGVLGGPSANDAW